MRRKSNLRARSWMTFDLAGVKCWFAMPSAGFTGAWVSTFRTQRLVARWQGLARSYLLSFHQHSRIAEISGLFFIHIPGYSPTIQLRPFVFNNIPGYTFIFAIVFLHHDGRSLELITHLVSYAWLLGEGRVRSLIPR